MKHWKILTLATFVAVAANVSRADDTKVKIPAGWTPHGSLGTTYITGFSAPEKEECGIACYMLIGTGDENSSSKGDFAAITKTVNVSHLQNQEISMSMKYSQEGMLENKDIWVRFFDERGEISKQRLRLSEQANDNFVPATMNFLVPMTAVTMELGFGLSGFGRFEFGALHLMLAPQRDSIANRIKSEAKALTVDPLTLSVDR